MLYFNYVANIIKFGICGDDGHVGICGGYVGMRGGICGDMCYMRDGPPCYMRDGHLPEITPAGLPFLGPPPQSKKGGKWERKTTSDPKKECLFLI